MKISFTKKERDALASACVLMLAEPANFEDEGASIEEPLRRAHRKLARSQEETP